MNSPTKSATSRATAALSSILAQASAVTLKDIDLGCFPTGSGASERPIDILAHVEVFGKGHTLACQMVAGSELDDVCATLEELCSKASHLPGDVTAVLILPVLSPEVQAICARNQAGCVDLCGNGRLSIGEIFISMRSLPRHAYHRSTSASPSLVRPTAAPAEEEIPVQKAVRGLSAAHAVVARRAAPTAKHSRTH